MATDTPTTNPYIPSVGATELAWLFDPLIPAERKAMAEIADSADFLNVDGEVWLLAPITSQETLDTLAAFAAEGEDCENCLEDEIEEDDDRSNDRRIAGPWMKTTNRTTSRRKTIRAEPTPSSSPPPAPPGFALGRGLPLVNHDPIPQRRRRN